jgi:hypothetical protein
MRTGKPPTIKQESAPATPVKAEELEAPKRDEQRERQRRAYNRADTRLTMPGFMTSKKQTLG